MQNGGRGDRSKWRTLEDDEGSDAEWKKRPGRNKRRRLEDVRGRGKDGGWRKEKGVGASSGIERGGNNGRWGKEGRAEANK